MAEQTPAGSKRARYSVTKRGDPGEEIEPRDIRMFSNEDETVFLLEVSTYEKYPDVYFGSLWDGKENAETIGIVDKDQKGMYEIAVWLPREGHYERADVTTRFGPAVLYFDIKDLCREVDIDKVDYQQ